MVFNNLSHIFNQPEIVFGIQPIETIIKGDTDFYQSQLNSVEVAHYNSLKLKKRKQEWLAGRLASKKAYLEFCQKMNLDITENVTILNSENKAPYFKENSNIHLSITHSYELAIAAVSYGPIGIDLERIDAGSSSLINYFFTDNESKIISQDENRNGKLKSSIIKYWTRKEAVSKYLKIGMKMNFRSVDVTHDFIKLNNYTNNFIKLMSYKMNDYYLSIAV